METPCQAGIKCMYVVQHSVLTMSLYFLNMFTCRKSFHRCIHCFSAGVPQFEVDKRRSRTDEDMRSIQRVLVLSVDCDDRKCKNDLSQSCTSNSLKQCFLAEDLVKDHVDI